MENLNVEKINHQLAEISTPKTIVGRVYQLYLIDQQESDLRYYGSTTRTLKKRFAQHEREFNSRINKGVTQGGVSSYKLFQKGVDKVRIRQLWCGILPSLLDLKREEDRWVALNTCVNKIRPLQGLKEKINRQYYQKVTKPIKQKLKETKKEKILTPTQIRRITYNKNNYQKNLLIILQCPMCYSCLPKAYMPNHKKKFCRNRNRNMQKRQQNIRQSENDFDDEDMVKMQQEQIELENEESYGDEDHQMQPEFKFD